MEELAEATTAAFIPTKDRGVIIYHDLPADPRIAELIAAVLTEHPDPRASSTHQIMLTLDGAHRLPDIDWPSTHDVPPLPSGWDKLRMPHERTWWWLRGACENQDAEVLIGCHQFEEHWGLVFLVDEADGCGLKPLDIGMLVPMNSPHSGAGRMPTFVKPFKHARVKADAAMAHDLKPFLRAFGLQLRGLVRN